MTDLTEAELDAIIEAHAEHWRYKGNDRAEAEIEKIGALARASLSPWREIESAPKDGTPLLLWWRGCYWPGVGRYEVGGDNDRDEGWRCDGDECTPKNQQDCTHWMPLPPPPSNGEREVMPRASELRADIEQPSEDSAKPLAALPSDPDSEDEDFEQALEEAERRGPNEALKELMASPSDPDSPTVRVVCPWCGRNMN